MALSFIALAAAIVLLTSSAYVTGIRPKIRLVVQGVEDEFILGFATREIRLDPIDEFVLVHEPIIWIRSQRESTALAHLVRFKASE